MAEDNTYYFGRSCFWLFLMMSGMGLYLNLSKEPFRSLEGAPGFTVAWAHFGRIAMLSIGPIGVIAALAVMKRKEWGRKAMIALLGIGILVILGFAVFWFRGVFLTPAANVGQLGKSRFDLLIGGLVVLGVQLGFVIGCIGYLKRLNLKTGDASPPPSAGDSVSRADVDHGRPQAVQTTNIERKDVVGHVIKELFCTHESIDGGEFYDGKLDCAMVFLVLDNGVVCAPPMPGHPWPRAKLPWRRQRLTLAGAPILGSTITGVYGEKDEDGGPDSESGLIRLHDGRWIYACTCAPPGTRGAGLHVLESDKVDESEVVDLWELEGHD